MFVRHLKLPQGFKLFTSSFTTTLSDRGWSFVFVTESQTHFTVCISQDVNLILYRQLCILSLQETQMDLSVCVTLAFFPLLSSLFIVVFFSFDGFRSSAVMCLLLYLDYYSLCSGSSHLTKRQMIVEMIIRCKERDDHISSDLVM